jgi:ribokinase
MSTPRAGGTGRVVVVGSVNIDLVMRLPELPRPGETVLGGVLARHHGGKGANQAVAAARAGARVHLIGAVGQKDGAESVRQLQAEGIDVTHVLRADAPTGTAAILVAANTAENLIAVASGANELVTPDTVDTALAAIALRPADVVVLSFELPGPALHQAADLAQQAGAQLVVNPAPAQPDLIALLAGAITTPNQHELAAYVGAEQTDRGRHTRNVPPALGPSGSAAGPGAHRAVTEGALQLSGMTGGPVLVTLGADGALLAADGRTEHFAGHRVDAVDTTGAGDTLTGVLAASLAAGFPLRASVRRAVAAAALSVTKAGARAGMPGAAAIDSLAGA